MIDTDDHRDYDDERAVAAEVRSEQEAEAAHEAVRQHLIDELRDLADRKEQQGRDLARGVVVTLNARGKVNASTLLFLHRAAEVAHLAARAARTVERFGGYALGAQVEALLLAHTRSASAGAARDYEVAVFAASRVRIAAGQALAGTREVEGLPGSGAAR